MGGEPRPHHRLLAGASSSRGGDRLQAHLDVHGPLHLPGRRDRAWAAGLTKELQRSGLTGRGGAGFPTGRKVATVAAAGRGRLGRSRPIVAVNVMEGEPASAKDRALATGTPHLVLDGAMALGLAVDATEVRVCVAAEHLGAASSLEEAAERRLATGLDPLPLAIDRVPGGYVAGEESALARWLDRGDGRPTYRPDRPALPRAAGRPVLVENAETTAHVALIARRGADWFRSVGLPDAPGTTLLTISGAVPRPGVWEVALGTSLLSVLREAGAGPGTGVDLGGALLGGYGGTWIAPDALATPLSPPALSAIGATIGAGVVVALPAMSCGLAETARIAGWMAAESAGQCGPCIYGLAAMAEDLTELCHGTGDPNQALQRLWFRLDEVNGRGACRHPDGVVRMVRSALTAFAADLDRHARHGPCRGARLPTVLALPDPGGRRVLGGNRRMAAS